MRITLKHLRVFVEVAKVESISEGAKACFISQSAASISLGQLEKILEVKLFDRNKNGLNLNNDGKVLFKKAIEIIEKSNEFELFKTSTENLQGSISVAANSVIATYILPKLLYKFHREYPNIKINIISSNLDKTFANIENEICEIGFVEGRVPLHEMKSEEIVIKKSELRLICSKNHPLAKYDTVSIDDIFAYKWAYYHDTFTTRDILLHKVDKNSKIMKKWTGDFGAFGVVASNIGSKFLSAILYFSAITFPFICGVMYLRVSVESLNILVIENILQQNATKNRKGIKIYILISFVVSLFIFFVFSNWNQVSTFIAALMAITYLIGPLATMNFRKSIPDEHREYTLKFANIICFFSFYFSSIIFFFSGWDTLIEITSFAIICSVIFIIVEKIRAKNHNFHFVKSLWFFFHLSGITFIALFNKLYPENFGLISILTSLVVLSLITYIYAKKSNLCLEVIKDNYYSLKK